MDGENKIMMSTSNMTVPVSRFVKYAAFGALSLALGFAAMGQAPAATPKSGAQGTTATKKPATSGTAAHSAIATRSTYDRALLHPALLKDKAPDTYVVKFVTTRGEFTV